MFFSGDIERNAVNWTAMMNVSTKCGPMGLSAYVLGIYSMQGCQSSPKWLLPLISVLDSVNLLSQSSSCHYLIIILVLFTIYIVSIWFR